MPRALGLTRVAIVEDHDLFAEALDAAMTLEGHDVHRVSIEDNPVGNGRLLTALLRLQPKVVLLDLDLGSTGNGARVVEPLSRAGIAVVVVTGSIDRARWGECLRYGARTVLPKTTPLNSLLATIRLIGESRAVMDREERERLVALYYDERGKIHGLRNRLEQLTSREREVLAHLMHGQPVREIARHSFVSEATVRTQVKSILAKLEVTSQLAAVGAAHQAGWRPPVLSQHR
jgi:two-component system, NarL family, nitrate/nitrite response regulator NarL